MQVDGETSDDHAQRLPACCDFQVKTGEKEKNQHAQEIFGLGGVGGVGGGSYKVLREFCEEVQMTR